MNLSDLKLSPSAISALVVLMAQARPIYNPDLEKIFGVRLPKPDRDKLVSARLITVHRTGRGSTLELADEGWRSAGELLRIDAIGGTGPTRGALRALLSAVDHGVQANRLTPADFFYRQAAPSDVEQAIRLAYKAIAKQPGDWVRFPEIRAAVAPASRKDVDAALAKLAVQADVRMTPVANLKSLRPEDREAAIKLGGEMMHAISIEG